MDSLEPETASLQVACAHRRVVEVMARDVEEPHASERVDQWLDSHALQLAKLKLVRIMVQGVITMDAITSSTLCSLANCCKFFDVHSGKLQLVCDSFGNSVG